RWAARVARIDAAPERIGNFDAQALEAWTAALDDNLGTSATAAVDLLATHDRLHGSELVETLWVFLTSRHAQDAAGRLYLHRNTLRYRMDLIKKITGLDAREPNERVMLHLQLRLAALRGTIATKPIEEAR
ncbi:MAG TPA: helix-turn-helix domain-containing protein, partial [Actinomycetota bacterium]|nr:helix-turn-helix domain-containing protein [Actinomycetota bacterium]